MTLAFFVYRMSWAGTRESWSWEYRGNTTLEEFPALQRRYASRVCALPFGFDLASFAPVPSAGDVVEQVARVLYDCEARREAHCADVLSRAKGKSIAPMMEPWEEARETFIADAQALAERGLLSAPPEGALKRFLAFACEDHYPGGGWSDFFGSFDTLAEATAASEKDGSKAGHVIDGHTSTYASALPEWLEAVIPPSPKPLYVVKKKKRKSARLKRKKRRKGRRKNP